MSVLQISQNNVDVSQATDKQLVFNDKYPFHKLDKTKTVSFQNIRLFFNREPPNPSGAGADVGPLSTLVYSFPHGYAYTPASWFFIQNLATNNTLQRPAYQQEGGYGSFYGGIVLETDAAFFTAAILRITVDATNVNVYIDKYYNNATAFGLPNIASFTLLIRAYVFVEDLLGQG